MIVKCLNTKKLVKDGSYENLRVGKEYVVLAIEFYDYSKSIFSNSIGDFVLYRIRSDDGSIAPFPAKLFEITKSNLGSNWVTLREKDGSFSLLPEKWSRYNFWDDYYNDDDQAYLDLKSEEKRLIDEA